jgi:hypothetical protein
VPILRINQQRGDGPHRYRIEITVTDIPGLAQQQFSHVIAFGAAVWPLVARRVGCQRGVHGNTDP